MNDSEEKITEQAGQVVPSSSEEAFQRHGDLVIVKRKPDGTFAKRPKTPPKSADITRLMRNLLKQPEKDAAGRITRDSRSRFLKMFENIFKIATLSPEQPLMDKFGNPMLDADGNVVTVKDAKIAMASVQAFKELMARAYGMPSKSDEELEAQKQAGVKIVVISPPPELMNRGVTEEKPREALVPRFAEVTEITENT